MKIESTWRFASVVLPLWLAACGGGDSSSAPTPPPAPAPSPSPSDTQAPTAALTAPANFTANIAGTLALTATATDNVAVTGVEFQVDGVQVGSTVASAPFTGSVDTNAYPSGQHIVRTRARDAAGNVSAWASATVSFGGTRTQPTGFTRNESWATGLSGATAMAQAPDGRIFVAQQGGDLRVIKNGALLATPFTSVTVDSSGERGLIGIALHPNFATNRWVYVYYTSTLNGSHNRISRFTAVGDVAGAASEERLVELPNLSSATNHNGGGMHFGTDGMLYVGVGDNADRTQAPDLAKVFGKLLRFKDDGTIPTDNPFFGAPSSPGLAQAIWSYGLRNPFTFAVQPVTGLIHINDVGESTWEEIDVAAKGANYGWGNSPTNSEGPDGVTGSIVGPAFAYKHSAATPAGSGPGGFFTGFAIAGGSFYPGSGPFPAAFQGNYFFADFVNRFIARFDLTNNAVYSFGSVTGSPVDMLTGIDGALYVLTRDSVVRFSAP